MKLNKKRLAVLFAEKELDVDRYCVGKDHPDHEKELEILSRMKAVENRPEPFDKSLVNALCSHNFSSDACLIM